MLLNRLNQIVDTNVLNISYGKQGTVVCVFMLHVYTSNSPERKFVPSVSASSVPSLSGSPSVVQQQHQQQHSPHLSPSSPSLQTLHHSITVTSGLKWVSDNWEHWAAAVGLTDMVHLPVLVFHLHSV